MNTKSTNETHALITPEHLRRRAVVYCRQAGKGRGDRKTGGTADPRSLFEIARSCGWPDSQVEVINDDLASSGVSAETRPEWQRLQELIKAGQIGAVFVSTISRLSRHALEIELFRLRAALHNTLLYADGGFMNPADECDRILSKLVKMRDRFFAKQKAKAGTRDAISLRRSARAKTLPRSVRGRRSGRRRQP